MQQLPRKIAISGFKSIEAAEIDLGRLYGLPDNFPGRGGIGDVVQREAAYGGPEHIDHGRDTRPKAPPYFAT